MSSTIQATGVHHGYRQVTLVDSGIHRSAADLWRWVLDGFAPVRDAWLSCIDPGGFVLLHRDAAPYYERWQVPVQPAGWMEQDGRQQEAQSGLPFRVEHWKPHSVRNDFARPRIHLVVDRDIALNLPAQPFEVFIPEGAPFGR
jgi:hypothetical protein